jgi:hypothetical protein
MNSEQKAAFRASSTAALVGGIVALVVAHPLTWAALAIGTYKIGRDAYNRSKHRSQPNHLPEEDTWGI